MILTKTVRVETSNCKKKNHYLSLGYDLSYDFFEAKIEDIPKFSNVLISVKCDICGDVQERTLSEYSRTTNKSDNLSGKWACSKKCGGLKLLENYKLKFGFHSPSHNPEIIEKTKKTNLER